MSPDPIVVEAPATVVPPPLITAPGEPLSPTTTVQEDLVVAGQRRINLIWEFTQAAVTILITGAAIYAALQQVEADVLNFAFVAVISTYYARTNHTKVGGIEPKYSGR